MKNNASSSRTFNTLINGSFGIVSYLFVALLTFINRAIFIRILGAEYLGINGLFSNVLSMLSLSELGIGSAIVYNMYKTVAENDSYKTNALMTFYAKVYKVIALAILSIGLLCCPLLQYFIKDNTFDLNYLRTVFIILVVDKAASYLFSYRSSIIFVHQRDYINKIIIFITTIVSTIAQILVMYFTKSYMLYLATLASFTVIKNITTYFVAKKLYPDVVCGKDYKLDPHILKDIITKVKALILHQVSDAVTNATDNIVIAKFVGILSVGKYSNYTMITTMLNTLFTQIVDGIQASLGNLLAVSDKEKIKEVFGKLFFGIFWLHSFAFTAMITLFNPFISLCFGVQNVLPLNVVVVVCVNFYILGMRQAVILTRNAGGYYTFDKIGAVIKPIVNLTLSIILVIKMGIIGVFIGTLISCIITDIGICPHFLYKNLFKTSSLGYLATYGLYACVTAITTGVTYYICGAAEVLNNEYLLFLIKGFVCLIVPNVIVAVIFFKNKNFRFFCSLGKTFFEKFLSKLKSVRVEHGAH